MIKKILSAVFVLAAATVAAAQGNPPPPPAPVQPPAATLPPAPPKATPATQTPAAPHTNLKVGQQAPDFYLPSTIIGPDQKTVRYRLSDFKGKKNVVLAFFVFAFTGG
ncbi:MAG TPA: hypothetical protein VJT71_05590 [Pyrinomonadaceae bacterium]|nr:hypothetical protein [Pyrinomonadaceae bacterium]